MSYRSGNPRTIAARRFEINVKRPIFSKTTPDPFMTLSKHNFFQGEISIIGVNKTKAFQYSQQFVREQNVLALEECVRDQFLNLINSVLNLINLNSSPAFAPVLFIGCAK